MSGLAIDWTNRNLYYTNVDFVSIDNTVYSWHRIEVVNVDEGYQLDVVTEVEEPRGLWVDIENR